MMKIFNRCSVFFLILLNCVSLSLLAQDNTMLGKANIVSPNAASIGKYGDIPVSYHTGVPNINIPIYAVTNGSLKMPVALSYHASGIRTSDLASWVGAGWTLQAGGVITRTIKDKPDEKKTTSLSQTYGYYSDYGIASYDQNVGSGSAESTIDREPDIFSFNFNGYSGKFSFTDDRTPFLIPQQDIKIESKYVDEQWTNSPGAWNGLWKCIQSFIITTPDGVKYYFGIPEEPVSNPYCDPIEVSTAVTSTNGVAFGQVISSWYLYKVVSPDGNFQIQLKYQRDKYAFLSYVDNSFSALNIPEGPSQSPSYYPPSIIPVKTLVAGVRLSSIEGGNDVVFFSPGPIRQDLSRWASNLDLDVFSDATNTESVALGSIIIKNKDSLCYKKYQFSYDYFVDNTSADLNFIPGASTDRKRLKLLSLQEISCDGVLFQSPHVFDYYTEAITRRLNFGIDHWGYQNGAVNNQGLYPQLTDGRGSVNQAKGIPVSNRDPAWPAMRAGTIKQITYPTGGYTQFEFEPHLFTVIQQLGGATISQMDKIVGGLRVKKITNYTPETTLQNEINYNYSTVGSNYSSGVLYGKPTYIMLLRNDLFKKTRLESYTNIYSSMAMGCPSFEPFTNHSYRAFLVSSSSLLPMENTQGYHIGYGEVKVSQQNNGFSVYRYNVTPAWKVKRDGIAVTHLDNPAICDTTIPNYPAAPLADDFKRGELIYEGHYKGTGNIVQEKVYQTEYRDQLLTIPAYQTFQYAELRCVTPYEIKTAKKIKQIVAERNYDINGAYVENVVEHLMESPYHNQVTKIKSNDSEKHQRESITKYSFDFIANQYSVNDSCNYRAISFKNFMDSTFETVYKDIYQQNSINKDQVYFDFVITPQFFQSLMNSRRDLIGCRVRTFSGPGNDAETKHDAFKDMAIEPLKTILWMQDNYIITPIEQTVWKNSALTSAMFYQYDNKRKDAYGVYLEKQENLELMQPLNDFSSITINGNNTYKDARYKTEQEVNFLQGNLVHVKDRAAVSTSYEWGYHNQYPIVKVINASNLQEEKLIQGPVRVADKYFLGNGTTNYSKTVSFKQEKVGNISIELPFTIPINAQVTLYYTLNGPVNQVGQLCASGFGAGTCSAPPAVTFSDMPVGQYILTYTFSSAFNSFSFSYSPNYVYEGQYVTVEGDKEFFAESFETSSSQNVYIGNAKTGKKYYQGEYLIGYSRPNTKEYELSWWSFENGKWIFKKQPYMGATSISGIIDEVRIHPKDAQMTTYTYEPLVGMTSECDPNNRITYFEYDSLGRLKLIRDQDRNIIKTYQYNYKQ